MMDPVARDAQQGNLIVNDINCVGMIDKFKNLLLLVTGKHCERWK